MPSQIIHALAGEETLRRAGLERQTGVTPAFRIGCQGPDVFSHNRRTRPFALAYSRLLHRRDYGSFCGHFAAALRDNPFPAGIDWLAGFVTHQAVDRAFHPYIVNRSYVRDETGIPGVSPALFHAFLERILDVCMLSHLESRAVDSFDTGARFSIDDADIAALSLPISEAVAATYPEEAAGDDCIRERVSNAFHDTLYFYDMTNPVRVSLHSRSGACQVRLFENLGEAGVALLFPDDPDPSVDWLNAAHGMWTHPVTGAASRLSVPDLFEIAVSAAVPAVGLVTSVLSGDSDPSDLEAAVGNGSLSAAGPDGHVGTVEHGEPFDLARALRAEADRRRSWMENRVC